jgi:hypothetical protein
MNDKYKVQNAIIDKWFLGFDDCNNKLQLLKLYFKYENYQHCFNIYITDNSDYTFCILSLLKLNSINDLNNCPVRILLKKHNYNKYQDVVFGIGNFIYNDFLWIDESNCFNYGNFLNYNY